jgi:Cu+-exporting ATPase
MKLPNQSNVDTSEIVWKVDGMTCANCAQGIRNVLVKKGLPDTHVSFANGEVSFTLVENYPVEQVKHDIENLGYTVLSNDTNQPKPRFSTLEKRLIFSAIFTLPLLLHMVLDAPILHSPITQLLLCLPVMLVGLEYFGKSAINSLKTGVPNMDVLISIGASSAFIYSVIGTFFLDAASAHEYLFFETSATIITLVMLGNVIEQRSVKQTGSALRELANLIPEQAIRVDLSHGHEHNETISAHQIQTNDLLRINEGGRIPADGIVFQGDGLVDESMITGESLPIQKTLNQEVTGGTLLVSGNILMKTTRTGKQTVLSGIVEMVRKAQNDKPPVQKLGDRISAIFVPAVLIIALLTLAVSLMLGLSTSDSLMHAIAVLVISCPCAMGLATPTAVMAGLGRAAKMGVLFRSGTDAEILAKTKILVFDKTGTLTEGRFSLQQQIIYNEAFRHTVDSLVIALEQASNHPLAASLREIYKGAIPVEIRNVKEIKGIGMQGELSNGSIAKLGSVKVLNQQPNIAHDLYLSIDDVLVAGFDLMDALKTDASSTVASLKKLGYQVIMLSGDRKSTCERVGQAAGIDTVHSECSPEDKLRIIAELKQQGKVAMVGDGINDAPALHAADVSISMSAASKIAIDSAGVILTSGSNLSGILTALKISKLTLRTIHQNLFWAFFYNVIAIPVAATGFLSPMIAAFSMAFSDVVVIGNSILLKLRRID